MPLYDFACNRCQTSFEAIRPASAAPPPCEACGAEDVVRFMPAPKSFNTIVATTPTSRRYKAGYAHLYNRPKEKISVAVPASPKSE